MYCSAKASSFHIPTLELGGLLLAKYKYISLKYKLFKYPAQISFIITDRCTPHNTFH